MIVSLREALSSFTRRYGLRSLHGSRLRDGSDYDFRDDSDVDEAWDATIAVPWEGIAEVVAGPAHAMAWRPHAGMTLRCCVARFENFEINGQAVRPTTGWTLNRHGRYDIHVPEAFPILTLSAEAAGSPPRR